ncbi:gliding motility-associated C-terminal domain-containing protein [Lewinella sp. W8]|uniref:T9SS type B sorting domain-containing protein n=1 Tax=Lewinella sp. W8 TaxID=2528208 RepID=UPI0012B52F26|nr:gliding motility-associated C-terminal domain-containing protein [Lewinella sp. W8]MTB51884.1 hypothetical protein [Lewinella sp. W8]
MKSLFFVFTLALCGFYLCGQEAPAELIPTAKIVTSGNTVPEKVPCSGGTLMITGINVENGGNGDNNPANGAFMSWTASGSSTGLYYSIIIDPNGMVWTIVQGGTSNSVFPADGSGNLSTNLTVGAPGAGSGDCLPAGDYVLQVWEVEDNNSDNLPDIDGVTGDTLGCYVRGVFTFNPSCPSPTTVTATANVTNIGCVSPTGSITLENFVTSSLYCVESNGAGATVTWTGPGGYTGSGTSISGLAAGTYTATISDAYGCPTTVSATVTSAPPVAISCSVIRSPTVFGGSDGAARVTINAGSGDYTISWTGETSGSRTGFDGSNTVPNLPAGTYTFTVTDNGSGCTDMCTVTIPDPPCEVDFVVEYTMFGDIFIRILNGTPDFYVNYTGDTFSPSDYGPFGNEGYTIPGSEFVPGDYIFTVFEAGRTDCQDVEFFTIAGPDCTDLMLTNEDSTNPSCSDVDDGTITVEFTGLDNPVISWNGPGVTGSNATTISGLGAGTYSYQIIDDEGCFLDGSYTLTAPPALTLSCDGINETRDALDDGMIALDVGGGTPGYRLSYTATDDMGMPLPPVTNQAITAIDTLRNLVAGTYQITITDDAGCTIDCTTTITQPNCDLFPDCVPTDASVIGGTGSVELTFDGTPDWTVTITGPVDTSFVTSNTTEVINDLPQGDYDLDVYNDAGCVGVCNFTIAGPSCGIMVGTDFMNPSCPGGDDGAIFLDISGQGAGLTIDWDDDIYDGQDTLRGLEAGTYSVIVSDATGCVLAPLDFTLVDPDSLRATMSIDTEISCAGDSTGGISVSVVNATPPLSYAWSVDSLPDAPAVGGLIIGTYSVTVTDANGCTVIADTSLTEPPALMLSCGSVAESTIGADDGRVGFDLSGGTMPYVMQLNGTTVTPPADDTFRMLMPGQYIIDVVDANGCTASCTAVVNAGGCGDFTVAITETQPDCNSATGSATATGMMGNGMITYQWDNGATTATVTNLVPGTYEVLATDAAGCTAVDQVTIVAFTDIPSVAVGSFSTVCDDACSEITLTFAGTPPFTVDYEIDRGGTQVPGQLTTSSVGDTTFTFCPADFGFPDLGNNSVVGFATVTDGNGCSRPVDQLEAIPAQQTQTGTYSETRCEGDTLRYFGEEFFAARTTGDVTLPFPAANGCDSVVTVTLNFFAPATGTYAETICEGDTLTYQGEIFHALRTTGDVVIPDASANGCDSTVTVTVDFFAPATGTYAETICEGDTLTFQGEIFHAMRTTGDVVLPDASANGCDSTVTVTVDFFAPATGTYAETICEGDTLTYRGEIFHALRTTGDVVLPDASANGCDSTVTVTIDFFAPATGTYAETICEGDTLTYQGEIFHALRTTGDVVLPDASANGCDSTVTVTVDFFAPATGTYAETICAGDTLTYQGEIFHALRTTGDVVLPDASANGCDSTVTVTVDFFAPATGTYAETICEGDTLTYQGEIFHAMRTTGDVVIPDASANGCDSTVTVTVDFFAPATGTYAETICTGDTLTYQGEIFHALRTTSDVVIPDASANGCDSTVTVTVDFFAPATGTYAETICEGDTLTFQGEIFHAMRTTGDVVLPDASANGCDSTVTVMVDFFAPATGTYAETICAGDTLTYQGEIFHALRTTGDVVIPDASANGCDSTVTVMVDFFAPATGTYAETICAGDTLTYQGEIFHAMRTTGDVVIPDASTNGCDSTVTVTIDFFAPATGTYAETICEGDTLTYQGEIFHAMRTIGDVVLPDASVNGCDSTVTVSIDFFAPAVSAFNTTICLSDTFRLNGEIFDANRTSGDVIFPDASINGCDSTVAVTIDFFPQAVGSFDTTICAGGSFTYGGQVFDEAVDQFFVTLPQPSSNGCDSVVAVSVTVEQLPNISLSGDGIICPDGDVSITLEYDGSVPATVFLSSDPGEAITVPVGGTTIQRTIAAGTAVSILSATTASGCPPNFTGDLLVTETDLAVGIDIMSGDGIFAVSCAEGSDGVVQAVVSGGSAPYEYTWSTGSQEVMVEGLPAGDYSLMVTSSRGCQREASITLNSPEILAVSINEVPANCVDTLPVLVVQDIQGGVAPYVFGTAAGALSPAGGFPDSLRLPVGESTFVLEDVNGCVLSQNFTFDPAPRGELVVTPAQSIIRLGDSVALSVLTDLNTDGFLISPGPEELISGAEVFVAPQTSTTYTFTAIDPEGCSATATAKVIVDRFVPIYAPTAFSPNLDGTNDLYRVFANDQVREISDFFIFDRWGENVFTFPGPVGPNDVNWGWDGTAADGRLYEQGTYVFSVKVTLLDGREITLKGDFVLMR